jgi:hypothetical protein
LVDAHYRAAVRFGTHVDVEANWSEAWLDYLQTYVVECGVPPDWREEAHFHIDSEFADAALWVEPMPASREGLQGHCCIERDLASIRWGSSPSR